MGRAMLNATRRKGAMMDKTIQKSMTYALTARIRKRILNDKEIQQMLYEVALEMWDEVLAHYDDQIEEDEQGEFVPFITGLTFWNEMDGEYMYLPLTDYEFGYLEHLNDVIGDATGILEEYHRLRHAKEKKEVLA